MQHSRAVTANDLLFGKHRLLRKGKKNYVVVTVKWQASRFLRHLLGADGVHEWRHGTIQ
jgi:hypothetical protein